MISDKQILLIVLVYSFAFAYFCPLPITYCFILSIYHMIEIISRVIYLKLSFSNNSMLFIILIFLTILFRKFKWKNPLRFTSYIYFYLFISFTYYLLFYFIHLLSFTNIFTQYLLFYFIFILYESMSIEKREKYTVRKII